MTVLDFSILVLHSHHKDMRHLLTLSHCRQQITYHNPEGVFHQFLGEDFNHYALYLRTEGHRAG